MAKRGQSKYMPHMRQKTSSVRTSPKGPSLTSWTDMGGVRHATMLVNEHGIARSQSEMETKGKYGGLCNRSACLAHNAFWWNRGSRAYYCQDCAYLINKEFRHRDDVENYGSLLLKCPEDPVVEQVEGQDKPWALKVTADDIRFFDTEELALEQRDRFRTIVGIRRDGSHPLWYKEMSERYEKLRGMVTIRNSW